MNKFAFTALAATLASTTAFANEADWPELDRELEALSSTLNTQGNGGGPQLSGWVISAIDFSGDVMPNGVDDLAGISFRSVRLNVAGSTADYGYKVSTDLKGGTAVLLDAYGQLNFTENFSMRMGNYKTPFLSSQMRSRKRELLLDRTFIGGLVGTARDAGLMFFGNFADSIGWWLSAQNGADGTSDGMNITARLAWDAMGEGAGQKVDGAYNSGDGTNMTFAVAYNEEMSDNDTGGTPLADDMDQVGGEVYITTGPFYIGGEVVSRGKGFGAGPDSSTPWDLTGSYLFAGDWEVALRYGDHDSTIVGGAVAEDTFGIGINKYVSGHDVKWQFQWETSTFLVADDVSVISLGLVLAF